MTINLDIIIDTPEYSVDMKSGLDTLQGASDATRCIAETLVTKRVPQRKTAKSSVRTILKKSFKGSFGHIFSVDFFDEGLKKEYRKIGADAFSELMSYFMHESLYQESKDLSPKAQRILNALGDTAEELIAELRISAMVNIHEVSAKFNHDVKIRYRKSQFEQKVIAAFNKTTVRALHAKPSEEIHDLTVSITRLNIHTGNGRLLIKGEDETIPFGFRINYKDVVLNAKKKFSENLDHNNGIDKDQWKYLKIGASPITLRDGKIVKYIVKRFSRDN